MAATELTALLRVLAERDLPLGEDDVAWAFEGSTTRDKAIEWVRLHVHPTVLLTKDEHSFAQRRGQDLDVPTTANEGRPLSEADFEAAIDSLEASTAAIEKQCQLLQSQKEALQEIKARNTAQDPALVSQDARQKKLAREKARLDFETDEISQIAGERVRALSKQSNGAISALPGNVERILQKDDRLLNGLQKILPKLSNRSEHDEESAEVEHLCSTLIALSAQEIRARLDKVYRESLADYNRQANGSASAGLSDQKKKQRETLRAELDELGSEIDGLAAIAIDQQHRKPLRRGVLSAQADSQLQKAKWSEYAVAAMAYLTSRLDTISEHIHHLHSHSAILQAVSSTLEESLVQPNVTAGASQVKASPDSDRPGGKGLKPLRLVQANLSESQDIALPFLRQHDVRVTESDIAAKILETLETTLSHQEQRLSELSKSTEVNTRETLSGSISRAHSDLRDALGAVYAHSTQSTVELVDEHVRGNMDDLEHKTQQLGEEMRGLDIDEVARAAKGKQRQVIGTLAHGQ